MRSLLILGFALSLAVALPEAAPAQTITVLHVSDTHSRLDSFGPKDAQLRGTLGGLARAATVIKAAQDENAHTLLLHGGDLFVGGFFFNEFLGVPELELLRGLGIEAIAVGSHDLDLGPTVLAESATDPGIQPALPDGFLLSANIDTSACTARTACSPLQQLIQPARIVEIGGVQIGLFGMTTPDDPTLDPSPLTIEGRGSPSTLVATALDTAAGLREAGADVVILLSNLGLDLDRTIAQGQDAGLQIDFILGGRDHEALTQPIEVEGTRIVSAGAFYRNVGQLRFTVDGSTVSFDDFALLPVGPDVIPDPTTQARVEGLKQSIAQAHGDVHREVIGEARGDLERTHDPAAPRRDTPLGNLVTDAYRFKTQTEIGLTASGFIAERIWKGSIVPADVFQTVPFGLEPATSLGSPLVEIALTGSELLRGVEIALSHQAESDVFQLQVSGLRYQFDSQQASLRRVVPGSVQVNGSPLDPDRVYSITANEAFATLAENVMGLRLESLDLAGVDEYTALRDYVRHLGTVDARSQGRIMDLGRNERDPTPDDRVRSRRDPQRRTTVKRPPSPRRVSQRRQP